MVIIDDGRKDVYIGTPDQPHIRITEEFIERFGPMLGVDYDAMSKNDRNLGEFLIKLGTKILKDT